MQRQINRLVKDFVRNIRSVLADGIAERTVIRRSRSTKDPKREAKVEKAAKSVTKSTRSKKRTAKEMQCRHVSRDGVRCTARSRGPRYHYLCGDHGSN